MLLKLPRYLSFAAAKAPENNLPLINHGSDVAGEGSSAATNSRGEAENGMAIFWTVDDQPRTGGAFHENRGRKQATAGSRLSGDSNRRHGTRRRCREGETRERARSRSDGRSGVQQFGVTAAYVKVNCGLVPSTLLESELSATK